MTPLYWRLIGPLPWKTSSPSTYVPAPSTLKPFSRLPEIVLPVIFRPGTECAAIPIDAPPSAVPPTIVLPVIAHWCVVEPPSEMPAPASQIWFEPSVTAPVAVAYSTQPMPTGQPCILLPVT